MKGYGKYSLRKESVIAPFVEWVNHFIFPHFLLIQGYGKIALYSESAIATFVEWFKIATLTKPY